MSKAIKQLQMDALKKTFRDVRDLIMLDIVGLDAVSDNKIRLGLRKKGIRLHQVKNSLCRRVFSELGLNPSKPWVGNTTIAFGGSSLKELSREIEAIVKKNDKKIKIKDALADGQSVSFDQALTMPTRQEAIGDLLSAILGPASTLLSQLTGPASQIASQLQTISEKPPTAST
ncbi:MAG: 50S ribosomal protein L10 [Gemmataceae bacterium]|nr:50S ribosomal protein L10 [Gemmataceae bacterium]